MVVFLVNWFLNIIVVEIFVIQKLKPVIKVDESRDSKFPAFRRNDLFWINRPWLYLTCIFMIIRIFLAFFALFLCGLVCNIFVLGLSKNDSIRGPRYLIMRIY